MRGTRAAVARRLVEQHLVQRRVDAVRGDHAAHQLARELPERLLLGAGFTDDGQHMIEVAAPDGVDQSELVGEILIERADAHTRGLSHLVGAEARPADLAQNASTCFDNRLDGGDRARLAWLLAHACSRLCNASRHPGRVSREYKQDTHI